MRIVTGLRCVGREPATVWRTLASLADAGFDAPHCFVDGPFEAIDRLRRHGEVTQRQRAVGGWPSFLLAATELYLREPAADAYLLVEDDVVFCRDVAAYLRLRQGELQLASLFSSARVEERIAGRGVGFTRLNPGWHVSSGSQALLFSNPTLERFLASDFVRSYRRFPPRDIDRRHFRRDGLHHTDCVVGRFAAEAACGIQYHYPSLASHIGAQSFMYPGFRGKAASRQSAQFPGEEASALGLG